ncbi:type II toxin-antitoxin system HicA family toxin [Endozoicomonas euniceicola]|uniref:Type II toxin-antitoxin system HicA family toxin n=1 Tax=Endozoicomonas euniceicola TaxID=1234143 RepID=A0ABY6H348_9GAMM|nr:type II toxin-antitoxin system HicA family toxin [Endozoicomonas euniceicola]UYM18658.1 type II toxin-antitoxin system HicA family toxin [Endozoicomonas euniceicola]
MRDEQLKVLKARGKGSHGTLYYGDKRTILKDPKKEIGKGLLNTMLEDLDLNKEDIEGL